MADRGKKPIDIFHPLGTLHWEECASLPERPPLEIRCMCLHSKLHVGSMTEDEEAMRGKLFISSPDLSSWICVDTPTSCFGLTSYHSQIVLLGGIKSPIAHDEIEQDTNEVWLSSDGVSWKDTIPPMHDQRFLPQAANVGTPERLVVTLGGSVTVEVFVDGQWSVVAPVPLKGSGSTTFSTLHNGNWILGGRILDFTKFAYCKVESLISAARKTPRDLAKEDELWKELPIHLHDLCCPVSFQDELLVLEKFLFEPGMIYAHSPSSGTWVHVGETPPCDKNSLSKLLVMDKTYPGIPGLSADTEVNVYKPVVQLSTFHYDSPFTMSALSKLEGKGFPIVSTLDKVHCKFATTVGVAVGDGFEDLLQRMEAESGVSVRGRHAQEVVSKWLSKQCPTWRELFGVLRRLGLEELCCDIEEYLKTSSGIKPLKEISMSVIMSALLQQKSLAPDQLLNLPDYVPPRDRTFINRRFKALVCPLSSPIPKFYNT